MNLGYYGTNLMTCLTYGEELILTMFSVGKISVEKYGLYSLESNLTMAKF